ncbi:hypothetical protein AAZV13_14G056150 [Glycine max]|uniref:uncharacterized protein isoform X1 n=1 Tax=Glycine max TaxID=3847 RepID=UPI0007192789|nr:uncharacterized protein LOC102663889 isoform X1 [Glycine max]|eukprot:XP_014622571.1 uncharacterized protein LOC102663889 isoform X1 [Glycine max]
MQSKIAASMGMDTAVESMHQLGFGKQLVPEMLKELLDVYGTSGWPYIEEASYKLLIEAILNKQQGSAEDKEGVINETSSAGISEVGSSGLVAEDTLILHASDGLDSSLQANDQEYASLINLETEFYSILSQFLPFENIFKLNNPLDDIHKSIFIILKPDCRLICSYLIH